MDNDSRLGTAKNLVDAIENGQTEKADDLLAELQEERFSNLFKELGALTRDMHDAVGNLGADKRLGEITEIEIPDTKLRLGYVIEKTEEAAHRTLSAVEEILPLSEKFTKDAAALHEAMFEFCDDLDVEHHLQKQILAFLEDIERDCKKIHHGVTEVMMAQEYQDLTGQVIKKTMDLVTEVEDKLVGLVRTHSGVKLKTTDESTSAAPSGPAVKEDENVMSKQSDVDDLLSSLGF